MRTIEEAQKDVNHAEKLFHHLKAVLKTIEELKNAEMAWPDEFKLKHIITLENHKIHLDHIASLLQAHLNQHLVEGTEAHEFLTKEIAFHQWQKNKVPTHVAKLKKKLQNPKERPKWSQVNIQNMMKKESVNENKFADVPKQSEEKHTRNSPQVTKNVQTQNEDHQPKNKYSNYDRTSHKIQNPTINELSLDDIETFERMATDLKATHEPDPVKSKQTEFPYPKHDTFQTTQSPPKVKTNHPYPSYKPKKENFQEPKNLYPSYKPDPENFQEPKKTNPSKQNFGAFPEYKKSTKRKSTQEYFNQYEEFTQRKAHYTYNQQKPSYSNFKRDNYSSEDKKFYSFDDFLKKPEFAKQKPAEKVIAFNCSSQSDKAKCSMIYLRDLALSEHRICTYNKYKNVLETILTLKPDRTVQTMDHYIKFIRKVVVIFHPDKLYELPEDEQTPEKKEKRTTLFRILMECQKYLIEEKKNRHGN